MHSLIYIGASPYWSGLVLMACYVHANFSGWIWENDYEWPVGDLVTLAVEPQSGLFFPDQHFDLWHSASISNGQIFINFHVSQKMNPNDCGDTLTVPLMTSGGWHFWTDPCTPAPAGRAVAIALLQYMSTNGGHSSEFSCLFSWHKLNWSDLPLLLK